MTKATRRPIIRLNLVNEIVYFDGKHTLYFDDGLSINPDLAKMDVNDLSVLTFVPKSDIDLKGMVMIGKGLDNYYLEDGHIIHISDDGSETRYATV